MTHKSTYKTVCGFLCSAIISLFAVNQAVADGTEQLGPPSIPIAPGSGLFATGTGLDGVNQPGVIQVDVPGDVSIAQVLLYWSGRSDGVDPEPENTDTIQVNGEDVTGPRIGGPTLNVDPYIPSHAYRADITEISSNMNWLVAGATNDLTVSGLDFDHSNDGAAVVIVWDDGTEMSIDILDGNDWAWLPEGSTTMPVDFTFEASSEARTGYIWLLLTDIDTPRPAAIDVTVDGETTRITDVLENNDGDFIHVIELEVPVPAGITEVTVQPLSIDDGSGLLPASLAWLFASWELGPPAEDEGCTYTIGYWKTHEEDWPLEELSLFSDDEAMDTLWTKPKRGNAYIILAHQYIAAELNVANGASIPEEVLNVWSAAQLLLDEYADEGTIPKGTSDRAYAIYLAGMLDAYNNGDIGPGHCD